MDVELGPRRASDWGVLAARVGMVACYLGSLALGVDRDDAIVLAGLAVVAVGIALWWDRHDKGPHARGARCSQSAALMAGAMDARFGQLSVTDRELIWTPTRRSRRKGSSEVRLPLAGLSASMRRGSSLTDIRLTVRSGRGPRLVFSTAKHKALGHALGRPPHEGLASTLRRHGRTVVEVGGGVPDLPAVVLRLRRRRDR